MTESDLPGTEQERAELLEKIRTALNPDNDDQMNQYIDTTVSYILGLLQKMEETDDKDKTAQEIANDLTARFESWVKEREAAKKDREKTPQ